MEPRLDAWLAVLHRLEGSDLLLSPGCKPQIRVAGNLSSIAEAEPVSGEEIEAIARVQIDDRYGERVHAGRETDFIFHWRDLDRIRASVFYRRGAACMVLRRHPAGVPGLADLGLPAEVSDLLAGQPGLLMVTGPAGSGRSTTAAALVGGISRTEACHVVTIEDPIEYLQPQALAMVDQRQVGVDTVSVASGLRSLRRQSVDVALADEVGDSESFGAVIDRAASGTRVIAVAPVNDSVTCLERLIASADGRPEHARLRVASALLGVLYQRLLPHRGGGVVLAYELLPAVPAVRRLIREGETSRLRELLAAAAGPGMRTLERSLTELVGAGSLDRETAVGAALYPQDITLASAGLTR